MRILGWLIEKQIAACVALLLAALVARAEPLPGQEVTAGEGAQGTPSTITQQSNSPSGTTTSSPGAGAPSSSDPHAQDAEPGLNGGQSAPVNGSQASPAQEQSSPAKPVGTAAAPAVRITGVAGSRVSGAAIAPAKQRRVRTFLIRVAVVVGACVAIGTVVALSHATPSQPR
jgi:hypothetical protein